MHALPAKNALRAPSAPRTPLLNVFLNFQAELDLYRAGKQITVDGDTLSLPAIVAAARFPNASPHASTPQVVLSSNPAVKARVDTSRNIVDAKLNAGKSIYGISTGFGGSADTRTSKHDALGLSLLQHQHIGVLPTDIRAALAPLDAPLDPAAPLPLLPPQGTSMPLPWVRGTLIVRANSLIRGHSGVRWRLMHSMLDILNKDITPIVPLRGSVSASGDLSPLSYVAGAIMGFQHIFVQCPTPSPSKPLADPSPHPHPRPRQILPASEALSLHGLEPLILLPKEHIGILNGTSFSASVGALIAFESVGAVVLAEVCTAMGTEALLGTQANFAAFISEVRPHPGQTCTEEILWYNPDGLNWKRNSNIRQQRTENGPNMYQYQRRDILTSQNDIVYTMINLLYSVVSLNTDYNYSRDDPRCGRIHGSVTRPNSSLHESTPKTRLALFLLAKLLFAQSTELLNPVFNRGLPPSVAATDPSLNYHAKGLDIAMASYVSELGWLASNVGTHVQSAEMHNQSVNSLALISGRATLTALEVLNTLFATYLYILCQALDLRALQRHYTHTLTRLLTATLTTHLPTADIPALSARALPALLAALDATTTMDAGPRLKRAVDACVVPILDGLGAGAGAGAGEDLLRAVGAFRVELAEEGARALQALRYAFVAGRAPAPVEDTYDPRAPAAPFLGRTRPLYEYIRITLGVRTHGLENWEKFEMGRGLGDTEGQPGVGRSVSVVYEAIRDGRMQSAVAGLFRGGVFEV
ncbi:phenylalanine ammonia-lyase [Ramaria rubella]|nr:phenylalanine ammonia-lyase [Ramaria rubella]